MAYGYGSEIMKGMGQGASTGAAIGGAVAGIPTLGMGLGVGSAIGAGVGALAGGVRSAVQGAKNPDRDELEELLALRAGEGYGWTDQHFRDYDRTVRDPYYQAQRAQARLDPTGIDPATALAQRQLEKQRMDQAELAMSNQAAMANEAFKQQQIAREAELESKLYAQSQEDRKAAVDSAVKAASTLHSANVQQGREDAMESYQQLLMSGGAEGFADESSSRKVNQAFSNFRGRAGMRPSISRAEEAAYFSGTPFGFPPLVPMSPSEQNADVDFFGSRIPDLQGAGIDPAGAQHRRLLERAMAGDYSGIRNEL
jgi:hypothetical protein